MKKAKLVRITTVPISFRLLLKGQLKKMSSYFDVVAISSPGIDLKKVYEEEDVPTVSIKMERKPSILKDFISLFKMIYHLNQIKPDIVHTHTPKAGFIGITASKIVGIKIRLHTVAGIPWIDAKGIRRKILWFIEFITYKFSTHIYCNSFQLMNFIINNKLISPSKISVLENGSSNGINTEYFDLNNDVKLISNSLINKYELQDYKVILFVGRKVRDKGIEELVEAFLLLKKVNYKIKLMLVGPLEHSLDPISNSITEIIKNDPDIINIDYVDDVRPYMALSYLLAFPSHREGFPNVPMQACALGLPCVVSDINGCNEIIINEKNGLIFTAKNHKALSEAIEKLLLNSELYHFLKSNARNIIKEKYDQNNLWNALISEYNKYLV